MCKSLSSRNSFTKDSKNGKYGLQEQYVLYKLFFNLGRTYYRRIEQRQKFKMICTVKYHLPFLKYYIDSCHE